MKYENSQIQVRLNEFLKKDAAKVFENLGLDTSTAIRIFLRKCVATKSIPFDISEELSTENALAAIKQMQRHSEEIGNSNMTLDEINQIIAEVRKERRKNKLKEEASKKN